MTTLKLFMMKRDEDALRRKIATAVGKKARKLVLALHTKILANTPMNTGRTLASWYASVNAPVAYDAESHYGEGYFNYMNHLAEDRAATNRERVGEEPGRDEFTTFSLSSSMRIDFEAKPYRKYFISNGAPLDSIGSSGLPQGPGSRAAMLEYGQIAGYDLFSHPNGDFIFRPRGTLGFHLAVMSLQNDWRTHL